MKAHRATAYWILTLSCIAYLMIPFHRASPALMAMDIMRDINITAPAMGLLASTFFVAYGLFQVPGGMLVDTFGARRVLPICLVFSGLGAFLFANASSLLPLIFARAFIGFSISIVFLSGLKLISRWFEPHEYPLVSGIYLGMGGIGLILASQPLAWLCALLGWRTTFLFCAVFSWVMAAALYIWIRDCPPPNASSSTSPGTFAGTLAEQICETNKPSTQEQWAHTLAGLKLIIRHRDFWYATLWLFCTFNLHMSFAGLWGGPFLMEIHKLSPTEAGSILNITGIGVLIGGPLCGYLSESVLHSRTKVMLLYSCLSTCLFIILCFYGQDLTHLQLYIWFFMLALLGIGGVSVAFSAVQDLFGPSATGTASGLLNSLPSCGVILFQPVTGFILEMSGRTDAGFTAQAYSNASLVFVAAGMLGIFAALRMRDPMKL